MKKGETSLKILILGFSKIKYMPYMKFYLDNIDRENNEIHLLYWNRDLKEESIFEYKDLILHEFKYYQEDDTSKLIKVKAFIEYRKYASKILKTGKFDFIFVLHSFPGVLNIDILKKYYKNKYIFDYRDSTYENIGVFRRIIGEVVKFSKATFVSSDAFRRFLPLTEKNKIFTSHNILLDSLNHRNDRELYGVSSDRIRIAFWGFIRHEQINRMIIKRLSCDERFELHYYGREQQTAINLKTYAHEISANNVYFHGEYNPEDRYEFIKHTDIIHNIYYDNNMMLAMGNKYYDGIIFRIPQICMQGSFMGKCVSEGEIGIECNPDDNNFCDKIYSFYQELNWKSFYENCNKELQKIHKEYSDGAAFIRNAISNVE